MSWRSSSTLAILPLAVLVGCAAPPEQVADTETTGAVTNGHVETGRFNVPRLTMETTEGTSGCSATLIGTHTLLTAAHCVGRLNGSLSARFPQTGDLVYAKRIEVLQDFVYEDKSDTAASFDIAVVELEKDIPAEPARIATRAPVEGQPVTLVGYGITSRTADDYGTLHSGTNTISAVRPYYYEIGGATGNDANICGGDSGGPDFSTIGGVEYVVGVHSMANCDALLWGYDFSRAVTTRADTALQFIRTSARGDLYAGDGRYEKKPPVVTIDAPSRVADASTSIDIALHASDDVRVASLRLTIDGDEVVFQTSNETSVDVTRAVTLTRGTHALRAEAVDGAGNRVIAQASTVVGGADPGDMGHGTVSGEDDSPDMAEGSAPRTTKASGCSYTDGSPASGALAFVLVALVLLVRRRAAGRA